MRWRRRDRLDGDVLVFGRRGVRKPSSSASAPRNNREILRLLPLARFRARFVQLLARRKGWRARGSRGDRANAPADHREDDSDDEDYAPASEDEADDDDASTTSSDASTTSSDASTTSSDASTTSSASASDSDSSDIEILGERPATPSSASPRARPSADPVAVAARALTLRVQSERGHGNCMFCAFSSGVNAWLRARGSIGPAAAAAGLIPRANTGGRAGDVTWAHLRAVLVRRLRDIVSDAPLWAAASSVSTTTTGKQTTKKMRRRVERRAREAAMTQLMSGSQGRDWLTRGALARASVSERFDAHLDVMSRDAKPHSGTSRWTRFWGTDVEAVALASALRVAVVCVETADGAGASGRSPFFLGVPADVAEVTGSNPARERIREGRSSPGPARFGRYMPRGEASDGALTWTAARGRVRLTVREVKANSAAASAAISGFATARDGATGPSRRGGENASDASLFPALVIIHRPGHFDSLQPREGRVLVLEREEVRGGER